MRNRHRHAIEQVPRRWREGRTDDSARTRRKILIFTQVSKKYSGEAWATHGKRPYTPARYEAVPSQPVWKSKFYDAFVLNHIVVLHAIDATPARWHGDADSSPLDGTSTATPCT